MQRQRPTRSRAALARTVAVVATLALSAGAATSYTVRPGDTLSEIAARHGTTSGRIAAANGLSDPHRIWAGRTLRLPSDGAATATASYTVKRGDTLSAIAVRLRTTAAALADANGIDDHDRIVVGRTLRVPATSGSRISAPSATRPSGGAGLPSRLRSRPDRVAYIPIFERWASHYGVPADLLMAMTWLESGWQAGVVSPTGAVGIGQIMPATTRWMSDVVIGVELDPRDPDDNIRMSARYLKWLLDRSGGDVRVALGGYYQGPRSVRERGLLAETERYVGDVVSFRDRHF